MMLQIEGKVKYRSEKKSTLFGMASSCESDWFE